MRIAIVHDWLTLSGGAEKVLQVLLEMYPTADLFCLVDFLPQDERAFLSGHKITTTFIQNLPFAKTKYRSYLPLMPIAIEQFDLTSYDLVISSTHAIAKGVITGPDQLHVSYCYSPIRYAWDMQYQYLQEANLTKGIKSWLAKSILHYMRIWDARTANGVDTFIADSQFVARRIKKCYGRDAVTIYPAIELEDFTLTRDKEDFYLTASRFVPYKHIRMIVEAFREMPDRRLLVIGDGPEREKIQAAAGANVELLGRVSREELVSKMGRARAFIFAAQEDFGIVPLEAQACGTPVIAYGKGGSLETVEGRQNPSPTGVFFYDQTPSAIREAIRQFEQSREQFSPENCRRNASRFSRESFENQFRDVVRSSFEKIFPGKNFSLR